VFEELIVRAYAMIELEQLTGSRVVAVAVSAGVQGYYHLYQGWRWAIASTAMFLAFSIYFVYAKRAVPIILAHLYIDALGIYFLFRQASAAQP
jgi:membrane protease YdiL (CAAX protease family)